VTNLSSTQPTWRSRFSRERLLLGAPIVLGGLVALGLLALDGWPRWQRLNAQQRRLGELEAKQASLPLLEGQLAKTEEQERSMQEQQALLVKLLAGKGQIQTFLAQLSRIAVATGVTIELYEPVPPAAPDASKAGKGKPAKTKAANGKDPGAAKTPKDPLAARGYEATSVLLQLRGSYQAVQAFLRRMEALELLVQSSDLEIRGVEVERSDANKSAAPGPVLTQLKLRLSFYDQVQEKPTSHQAPKGKDRRPPA
jgi:type IV pilus assembly protein PilO